MSLSRDSGVYEPADLAMLQRVFDRLCDARRLAKKDREQREFLAMELFQIFDDGTNDEAGLLHALSKH
ncbi:MULTISPECIES: hypothetical protein [unclassified Mesorhizobium]|uniref:hypothetical protein n=1 Tax=unclassified Mesorhizobium TaxID=325217 RepID=UPI0016518380|nr:MULTISPECIES: hypothetical protein [unclassified Mesorhizobium]